ncbi:MAG: hypothetical protein Q9162_002831 [Coniocarpon cinnabarinum]
MDINQVLKDTVSPDPTTRQNAETQLVQAADGDFSGYVRTLSQELANEQADVIPRMAAALSLKNSLTAREFSRLKERQDRWQQALPADVRNGSKAFALQTLKTNDSRVSAQAAQFVAAIAAIELPRNQWPELMPILVENVGTGSDHLKQASLQTIGYICENQDANLQLTLSQYSNSILTAVVQGARREEPNTDVRNSAITALSDSLEFVRSNFENEGERNYIMQVICEATQANDTRIIQGAYGCLNRIMALYYDRMFFYMEKALFGLTVQGMKHEDEDVAKLAVEFWCTVCEEEISIEDDNAQAEIEGSPTRPYFNFSKIATAEVVPVLLDLLSKQDEDAADDEYNLQRAAYQCLQLWAQSVGNAVVQPVLQYVEANIRSEDWHLRDASASAFGAIMEGPDEKMLDNIVKQALPILIGMMSDPSILVKDSVAFTLGRISECVASSIDTEKHLPGLVESLFSGLASHPRMASSCCWALMNLANNFAGEPGAETNPMTNYFEASVSALLQATERNDADSGVRTAAYEVLNTFITNAASKSLPTIAAVSEQILQRLEGSIPLRQQALSVEDRLTLDDIQTSLCTVVMAVIQRIDSEIAPQADRIMNGLLQLLSSLNSKSSVADSALAPAGALATALGAGFHKYMEAFKPYLFKALNNRDEPGLCAVAIGLTSDVVRALEQDSQPYCDDFMNALLENLRSTSLGNQFKPAILQCFGDIAQAIGGAFETYLKVVAQVLDQAASISTNEQQQSYEVLDYIVSLREGIMDAWAGAIIAMTTSRKADRLKEFVDAIFRLLHTISMDLNRSEALLRSSMGVLGDLADAFPNGEIADYYRNDWVASMVKEAKSNRDHSARTIQTAKWAREQVRRQTSMSKS